MKLNIFVALILLLASAVHAGDVVWDASKPDGSYDLSAKENWSSGNVPGISDTVKFPNEMKSRNYIFTTLEDLCFQKFSLTFGNSDSVDGDGNNITFDLSADGIDRVMELEGVANTSTMRIDGQNSTLTLKSGTIKPTDGVTSPRYFMANVLRNNNKVFIDGVKSKFIFDAIKFVSIDSLFCVTNGGYVQGAMFVSQAPQRIHGTCIQVTGEGSVWNLHTNRNMNIDLVSSSYPLCLASNQGQLLHDILVKVDNKGVLTNFCGYVGHNSSGAKVLIDNGIVYARNAVHIGSESTSFSNSITVCNGGLLKGSSDFVLSVGHNGKWNTLRIDGVGSTCECNSVSLGTSTSAAYNTIEVSNGGMLNVGTVWSEEKNQVISGFNPFGKSHNNQISITGAGSKIEFASLMYAGESETATNNLIEVADGGELYGRGVYEWAVIYLNNCAHNTVRVREGGKIDVDQFSMGMTEGGENSISNVLEIIGEDSIVNVRHKMYLNGVDNVVTISNGLLRVLDDNEYLNFSQADGRSSVLNLEGKKPRIEARKFAANNTKISFKIPEGGFADTPIVYSVNELTVNASCSLEIEAEHTSEAAAVLMQCKNNELVIPDSVIKGTRFTGSKAALYKIMKSTDGKQLLLKSFNGTIIIVR